MFDNTRLKAELNHIHRTLSVVAAGARGKHLVEDLRHTFGGTTAVILWQSLFADCVRVAHGAVSADGSIGDDEIEALYEFLFSAARHYAHVMPASYGEFAAIDHESARAFLDRYASDRGLFGRGSVMHWPGLTLCRGAAELGEPEALERYERMMTWLITAACQVGGVTEADPRWRGRVDDLDELRRTLARDAEVAPTEVDLRVQAFLEPTRVFASVQQPPSVFVADPFDVETIHAEAREAFEQMVEHATSVPQPTDGSRMLLVLGDAGSGKTHLLRGFRRHVQEYGRGFVAYAQLHSSSDDYSRYLLQHVVDSLARPYAGPSGERTGLHELASGLPLLLGESLRSKVERLTNDTWEGMDSLADHVNRLVDEILEREDMAGFDPDLLRVMMFALRPDQRISRVYKYLCCEDMTAHDRSWIGNVAPRTGKDDPGRMIRQLARLAFATRRATLVLMVDQAELAGGDANTGAVFRRAIDALYRIVSEEPSAIAVVACLSDVYTQVRGQLTKSAIDRLENDPPLQKLQINRSYPEIEAIVSRRLSWLFTEKGAVYRPETPVYPIPEARLRALTNHRTRHVLEWCHELQTRCAAAGKIIDLSEAVVEVAPPEPTEVDLDRIAAAWNDAMHEPGIKVPDDEEEILAVVGAAAKACADEVELSLTTASSKSGALRVQLASGAQRAELAIAVTNSGYQGGWFAGQIDALRKGAGTASPIAVRTLEFPRGESSDKALGRLMKAGGRRVYVDASTLRTLVAFQRFQPRFPSDRVEAWRRRDRPISGLPAVAEILDLEGLHVAPLPPAATAASAATAETRQPAEPPPPMPATSPSPRESKAPTPPTGTPTVDPSSRANGSAAPATAAATTAATPAPAASPAQLRIGTSTSFRAEARTIELGSLLRHTGILGSSGSGKTTLALNLIEQALERDIAVLLLDRKGDLAGYAKPDWWEHTADPARARRLAERIDVRLFTPGTRGGRPLSLSVIPELEHVPEHERDRMIQYAAQALGAMMRLGSAASDTARLAILTQAIAVLSGRRSPGGLPELIALLEDGDDELLARAHRYDEKLFKRLVQDLETVRLSDADLFDPAAEALTAETLIGRKPGGKVPLAIASTRFLGDVERIQSWVAHLIGCLSRHVAKVPSTQLHTLFMIDEADLFMPAGMSKPPSKEPLQDLLKRARAAGLGVVLASQSPADFDYRSREQINTWFLGRIADRRSIDKMKPLFEHRPQVRGKLANLEQGRFVMLQDGGASDLERAPSLLRTEQLSEAELMALAARSRERR